MLALAHPDGRAVMTHNRKHFRNLHNIGRPHSGMVLCTEDVDFDSLATRVDQALSQVAYLAGQVIRVTRARGWSKYRPPHDGQYRVITAKVCIGPRAAIGILESMNPPRDPWRSNRPERAFLWLAVVLGLPSENRSMRPWHYTGGQRGD